MHTTMLLPAPEKQDREEEKIRLFRETYPLITGLGLVRTIGVYAVTGERPIRFTRVEDFTVSGIAALAPQAFVVRVVVKDIRDKEGLTSNLRSLEALVRSRFPEHRMLPSHPGWTKRTIKGAHLAYVLFGKVPLEDAPNHANSRLTRLIGHIDEQSRYLGQRRVRVIRGVHEWDSWDGWCLLNPDSLSVPTQTLKVYGVATFGTAYIERGAPTVKCCAEVSRELWNRACRHLGMSPTATDVIIPEISLKFDDGRDTFMVELFNVFESVLGEHCTISMQLLMNVPLTEEAHVWAASRTSARIEEINQALEDPTGLRAAALMDSHAVEVSELLASGEACEEAVEEGTEAMRSLITRIVAGLPLEDSKYLKGTLPVLLRRLRNFTIAGGSEMVVPDNRLRPGEVSISRRLWRLVRRKYGIRLSVGDTVLVVRYPVTGTEVAACRIAAIGRPAIHPEWWKERFSGDFDGDRYAIGCLHHEGIATLLDETRFAYPPKSEKIKTKVAMDRASANAAGFWSQAMIPTIDTYVRICNEKGLDAGPMKNVLQWTIDSAKNQIEFDIAETCRAVGIREDDRMSALATLMSGRLGTNKHQVLLVTNGLIRRARYETTHIDWMNRVRKSGVLAYAIPHGGDPAYATLARKVDREEANGYEKFLVSEMQRVYREVHAEHLVLATNNMEKQAVFPLETLDPKRVQAVVRKAQALPLEARTRAREIVSRYTRFMTTIQSGVDATTEAFQCIKDAVEMVQTSEAGDAALKYLYAALCLRVDNLITMRATTVLGYMPLVLGSYNVARINAFLGYERSFHVAVLRHGRVMD